MSFIDRLKNRVDEVKAAATKFVASDEVVAKRIIICKSCPELNTKLNMCQKCGCFITTKTKIDSASCPLGKW